MTGAAATIAGIDCFVDALGLHRRGRLRDLGRRPSDAEALARAPARRARGQARRPRRARHAAPRSRPVPLRPRHRRRRRRRSRPASTWAIQKVRRPGGARAGGYPGAATIDAPARQRRRQQARRPASASSACRCAKARRSSTTPASRSAASPAARSARASASRSRMAYVPTALARCPARGSTPRCAASASRCASRRCRSRRTATSAADHAVPIRLRHRGARHDRSCTPPTTSGSTSATPSAAHRRHHRRTRRTRSATSSSSTCPTSARRFKKGEVAGVVESVKAAADLYMPVGGEVVEVNEALRADPSLANSDPLGTGWFFKVHARAIRPRLDR